MSREEIAAAIDELLEADRNAIRVENGRIMRADKRWPDLAPLQAKRDELRNRLIDALSGGAS